MGQMLFVDVLASSLQRPLWILVSPVSERMCGLQFEQGTTSQMFCNTRMLVLERPCNLEPFSSSVLLYGMEHN